MGLQWKKMVALATASCLMMGSIPDNSGITGRQAQAARAAGLESNIVQQEKEAGKKQNALRGVEAGVVSPNVVFSKGSGTYPEDFDLELTCETATAIYYTTDGSDPSDPANASRQQYTPGSIHIADREGDPNVLSAIDPILFDATNVKASADGKSFESTVEKPADGDVDKCTVIKAAAQFADGTCSAVTTNTYFIGEMADHIDGIRQSCEAAGMDLSVMSISMDADDLFDSKKGIYVKGDVFNQALEKYLADGGSIGGWGASDICRGMDANYKQKGREWERETHIDYFESDGTNTSCKLQQDCGVRIQGNYSRSDYQKSFRLYARADYGEKNFKYGFWNQAKDDSGNVIEKYKKIVLRNGGNCAFTTKFADSYWQSLMEGIDCDTQSARPCVVYLNGEYWGVYVLQDDYCGAYFENKHGVDKDSVIIYKGDAEANRVLGYKLDEGELPEGVTNEDYYFQDIENFMREHNDLSNPADYEAFCQLVDADSALDYFATQVWINNKWDWPGKNWSMWKSTINDPTNPYADGKWRFLMYDVEFGGISGRDDARANTVANSKLLLTGTADKEEDTNWDKPNVRCFALLMTNPGFREKFNARLTSFSDTMFERSHILERANQFRDVYQPILDQFFNRFPTLWNGVKKTADMVINGNGGDTYGTWKNIVAFAEKREGNINKITKFVNEYYPDVPTPPATEEPTAAPPTATPPAAPTGTPIPSVTPPASNQNKGPIVTTLSDGAKKIVTLDANGKTVSTKYQIKGVTYLSKGGNTLAFSVDNKKSLKKKTSYVVQDEVVAGGNRFKVTEIEAGAFQGLTKLKSVTIGVYVKTIGKNAFRGCKKLKKITFLGKKVKKIGNKAFYGIAKKAKMICQKSKKKAYQKLIKKSGVNYKKTKIKVTVANLKVKKGDANASPENENNRVDVKKKLTNPNGENETAESADSGIRKSADSAVISMSSLRKEDGSLLDAVAGTTVTISSAEELKMLSEYTKAEHITKDVTFKQTAEIDAAGVIMEPIGVRYCKKVAEDGDEDNFDIEYEDKPFCGTYDGGEYALKNLTVSVKKSSMDTYYLAMFGITNSAILQNIVLDSISFVDADTQEVFVSTDQTDITIAGIVAEMVQGTITGCTNRADITVAGNEVRLAGVAGAVYSDVIENCHNIGKMTAQILNQKTANKEYINVGGVCYYASNILRDCTNKGEICSDGTAAGIVDDVSNLISNCSNIASVTGKHNAAGIIKEISDNFHLTKCLNTGKIQSDGTAGGIAVYLDGSVYNSENSGEVQGENVAGGIVGMSVNGSRISGVKNQGNITGKKVAGGIVGAVVGQEVSNAQNLGDVSADQAAGGIAGFSAGTNVGNLWNFGKISGASQVGGIIGSSDPNLQVDEDLIYVSEEMRNRFFHCIHKGILSGGTEMGAMIGKSGAGDQINDCFYLEGTEYPASGSDQALAAQAVAKTALEQQSFLDELNQNQDAGSELALLPMKYDVDKNIAWEPKIFLYINCNDDVEDDLDKYKILKDKFIVRNIETNEEVPLVGNGQCLAINPEKGIRYSVDYRDFYGAEDLLYEDLSLQEGEVIFVQEQYIGSLCYYTDVEKLTDWKGDPYYKSQDLYQVIFYLDADEFDKVMPEDPKKPGYEFGGWYSDPGVVREEYYEQFKEEAIKEFQEAEKMYREQWEEDRDEYENEEEYVRELLTSYFGAATLEQFKESYDAIYDSYFLVSNLDDLYQSSYPFSYNLYAKWTKKKEAKPEQPGGPDPKPAETPKVQVTPTQPPIDLSQYQDKVGNYVQEKGLIYKVNRKKKTAALVGVTSRSISKATLVAKVSTGGKTYKVTSVSKKAFQGCIWLKTIKAKGKDLKKLRKKALKFLPKKK